MLPGPPNTIPAELNTRDPRYDILFKGFLPVYLRTSTVSVLRIFSLALHGVSQNTEYGCTPLDQLRGTEFVQNFRSPDPAPNAGPVPTALACQGIYCELPCQGMEYLGWALNLDAVTVQATTGPCPETSQAAVP